MTAQGRPLTTTRPLGEILDRLVDLGYEFSDRTDLVAVVDQLDRAHEDEERVPSWLRSEAHAAARRIGTGR